MDIINSVKLYSMHDIRKMLPANHSTVRKILSDLGISPQKVGNAYVFTEEELELIKQSHAKISRPRRKIEGEMSDKDINVR